MIPDQTRLRVSCEGPARGPKVSEAETVLARRGRPLR